jgi:hypothetical protein
MNSILGRKSPLGPSCSHQFQQASRPQLFPNSLHLALLVACFPSHTFDARPTITFVVGMVGKCQEHEFFSLR